MKVHYRGGRSVIKKDNRRLWWYCGKCREPHDMVIEDEFYDEPTYRIEVRCVNCRHVISIDSDELINSTRWIDWSK